ncbi:MAG TPA: type II toxin-antitoxin system RelE/ParE family toxin [Pirellulales bacterium]|jgi:plasmid stabilization system protein ParE|nr:type II toxin-antitoxin system RelE/ParE family toxin [Pirellulales bacterium]
MAPPEKLILRVIISPAVITALHEIWQWNAERYCPSHADAYLAFLKRHVYGLDRRYKQGKTLTFRPELRYIMIRRKSKGHGHVVVYRFDNREVNVLLVFHTAQDWQTKLADETSS